MHHTFLEQLLFLNNLLFEKVVRADLLIANRSDTLSRQPDALKRTLMALASRCLQASLSPF